MVFTEQLARAANSAMDNPRTVTHPRLHLDECLIRPKGRIVGIMRCRADRPGTGTDDRVGE